MSCSIVIPNWNGRRFLDRCLRALRAQTLTDFEAILVDNGSTDDSVALIEAAFPEVSVVRLSGNRGFAAAMNAGIERAQGRYVAFLNNDTEAKPTWLAELRSCLERHPQAAAATSKMLLLDRPDTIDDAGDALTPALLPYARGHGARDEGRYEQEEQVFSASGGAALWRKDVLDEIGGFDESFFAYYEDVDLGFRARLAGYECWYAPGAVVLHERGGSAEAESDFALFHHVRNRWLMVLKNAPTPLLARSLHRILLGEATWWVRGFKGGRVRTVAHAYVAVLRSLGRVRGQRREIQARRRVATGDLARLLRA